MTLCQEQRFFWAWTQLTLYCCASLVHLQVCSCSLSLCQGHTWLWHEHVAVQSHAATYLRPAAVFCTGAQRHVAHQQPARSSQPARLQSGNLDTADVSGRQLMDVLLSQTCGVWQTLFCYSVTLLGFCCTSVSTFQNRQKCYTARLPLRLPEVAEGYMCLLNRAPSIWKGKQLLWFTREWQRVYKMKQK